MSSPPPTTTSSAPPPVPSVAATTAGSPVVAMMAGSATPAPVIYTPEQMSGVINDLVTAVQGIRLFLIGSQGPPTPPQPAVFSVPAPTPWVPPFTGVPLQPPPALTQPWTQWPPAAPAIPSAAATGGVPIQQIRFPPSLSPLPAWLAASSTQPVYTTTAEPPMPSLPSAAPGGYARPHEARPDAHGPDGVTQPPPRYTKVDFATYDGPEDP
nr:vegetative cell wall protein gp1-like [Lolium perenne]